VRLFLAGCGKTKTKKLVAELWRARHPRDGAILRCEEKFQVLSGVFDRHRRCRMIDQCSVTALQQFIVVPIDEEKMKTRCAKGAFCHRNATSSSRGLREEDVVDGDRRRSRRYQGTALPGITFDEKR
jgi:hypothetical protein